jgi:hypothetical protein
MTVVINCSTKFSQSTRCRFKTTCQSSGRLPGSLSLLDFWGARTNTKRSFEIALDWRDYLLFHEYFQGDNGAGLGSSHQTGWTGSVAKLIQLYGYLDPKTMPEAGRAAAFLR